MEIILNGKRTTTVSATLRELLAELKLSPKGVVAEVNKDIVQREEYETFGIKDKDAVELVTVVGGG